MKRFNWSREMMKLAVVFGTIYFVQGMQSLPALPVNYLMKNVLKLDPAQAQFFGAVTSLAWLVKPIWGYLSDTFPIFGYRRKTYLAGMSLTAAVSWFWLAGLAYHQDYRYWTLLILFNFSAMAYAFVDVVCDGLMVENGKRTGLIDQFVNIQWFGAGIAGIVVGLASGYLAELANKHLEFYPYIFGMAGIIPLITSVLVLTMLSEEPVRTKFPWAKLGVILAASVLLMVGLLKGMPWFLGLAIGTRIMLAFLGFVLISFAIWLWAGRPGKFWAISFLLFFWNFSPSVGTARFYYLIDVLKFSEKFFGFLNSLESVFTVFGIVLYGLALKKWPAVTRRTYLYFSIFLGAIGLGIQYLYYLAPATRILGLPLNFYAVAIFSGIFFSILGAPGFLVPLALAGDAARSGKEAVTYAWFMSVLNFGAMMSSLVGGWMYKTLEHADFSGLTFWLGTGDFLGVEANKVLILRLFVWISALFTLAAIPVVWWVRFPERGESTKD